MKNTYITPEFKMQSFYNEEILTASSADITKKALRSGNLKVNGKSLDDSSNILSIEF